MEDTFSAHLITADLSATQTLHLVGACGVGCHLQWVPRDGFALPSLRKAGVLDAALWSSQGGVELGLP